MQIGTALERLPSDRLGAQFGKFCCEISRQLSTIDLGTKHLGKSRVFGHRHGEAAIDGSRVHRIDPSHASIAVRVASLPDPLVKVRTDGRLEPVKSSDSAIEAGSPDVANSCRPFLQTGKLRPLCRVDRVNPLTILLACFVLFSGKSLGIRHERDIFRQSFVDRLCSLDSGRKSRHPRQSLRPNIKKSHILIK